MKKNILKITLLGTAFFSLTSCRQFVEDVTTDQSKVTIDKVGVTTIFQSALLNNQYFQNSGGIKYATMWMNQGTGSDRQFISINDWNKSVADDFSTTWANIFVSLNTARDLQDFSIKESNNKTLAVGQIIEAFTVGTGASLFGDLPYSEYRKATTPKLDAQKDVYAKVQQVLDQAIINLTKPGKITGDLYYAGDASKWTKAAYTLKAKFYLHTKEYANAIAAANKGIDAADGDMIAPFGGQAEGGLNPWYSFIENERYGYLTADNAYAPKLLDPANALYRGGAKTDETARFNYTYGVTTGATDYWFNTSARYADKASIPTLTVGENLLIKAAAEIELNQTSNALDALNAYRALLNGGYSLGGATAGFKYDPYVAGDFATPVALKKEVYQERYVYFIGNYEAWTDYRRTNNAAEIPLLNFAGKPERFPYGQNELNSNPNVVFQAVTVKTPIYK
jgi:starch-binding outer membrane protein, SusD/RagB family